MATLLRNLAVLFAAAVPLAAGAASSQPAAPRQIGADLVVEPKRMILEPARRAGEVAIAAPAAGGDFDVAFIDRIMAADGALVPMADAARAPDLRGVAAAHRSAKPLLSVDAARVSLRPGEVRTLTVRLRGPRPADGEYRTHLTVTARDPSPAPKGAPGPATMLWAQSIPVFVRIGPVDARAAIEGARLERSRTAGPAAVSFDLVRLGRNSLFGDVTVTADGEPVAVLRSIGVYPEISRRRVSLQLPFSPSEATQLEVAFTDRDSRPGVVLASARVGGGRRALAQAD